MVIAGHAPWAPGEHQLEAGVPVGETSEEGRARADDHGISSQDLDRVGRIYEVSGLHVGGRQRPVDATETDAGACRGSLSGNETRRQHAADRLGLPLGGESRMDDVIDANIILAGRGEDVGDQIIEFSDQTGGIGSMLMMGHGGDLSHEETKASVR